MRKLTYLLLKLFGKKEIASNPSASKQMSTQSIYNFKLKSIDCKEIDFANYKGKKLLIVNTASECGYTPQYTDLQALHEKHDDKVIILGFPANNFGGQEPGENAEIGAFCQRNFGVTFQLFEKSDVIGNDMNALYKWLTTKSLNGWNEEKPNWNFCKYLISENGELLKFYSSAVSPLSDEIVKML